MKKALFLFFLSLTLATGGPDLSCAQAPSEAGAGAEASQENPDRQKKKRGRRKAVKRSPAAEAAAAAPAPAAPRPVEPKRVNSLLFGTMERLETLLAYHDNLGLQASEETHKKISETEAAANKAAAGYFSAPEPASDREALKSYRGLLDSALKSVKMLKDAKDRLKPEESEAAILLCRELNEAIDRELAGAKLSAAAGNAEPSQQAEPAAAAPAEQAGGVSAAAASLAELKKALEAYKAKEGKYPRRLGKLAPKYISELPEITAAEHPATRQVLEIDSADYDDAPHQAITDTGKWLYFADKKSKLFGRVTIDCTHKDAGGAEFYKAGE